MRSQIGTTLLIIAAVTAFVTALAHLSCLYFGAQCYAVQMAPKAIVDSAAQGTWLAPVGNIAVSSLFILAGCYALAGCGVIKSMPGLRLIIVLIAAICLLRGLLPLFVWILLDKQLATKVYLTSFVWFSIGICFWLGWMLVTKKEAINVKSSK